LLTQGGKDRTPKKRRRRGGARNRKTGDGVEGGTPAGNREVKDASPNGTSED